MTLGILLSPIAALLFLAYIRCDKPNESASLSSIPSNLVVTAHLRMSK